MPGQADPGGFESWVQPRVPVRVLPLQAESSVGTFDRWLQNSRLGFPAIAFSPVILPFDAGVGVDTGQVILVATDAGSGDDTAIAALVEGVADAAIADDVGTVIIAPVAFGTDSGVGSEASAITVFVQPDPGKFEVWLQSSKPFPEPRTKPGLSGGAFDIWLQPRRTFATIGLVSTVVPVVYGDAATSATLSQSIAATLVVAGDARHVASVDAVWTGARVFASDALHSATADVVDIDAIAEPPPNIARSDAQLLHSVTGHAQMFGDSAMSGRGDVVEITDAREAIVGVVHRADMTAIQLGLQLVDVDTQTHLSLTREASGTLGVVVGAQQRAEVSSRGSGEAIQVSSGISVVSLTRQMGWIEPIVADASRSSARTTMLASGWPEEARLQARVEMLANASLTRMADVQHGARASVLALAASATHFGSTQHQALITRSNTGTRSAVSSARTGIAAGLSDLSAEIPFGTQLTTSVVLDSRASAYAESASDAQQDVVTSMVTFSRRTVLGTVWHQSLATHLVIAESLVGGSALTLVTSARIASVGLPHVTIAQIGSPQHDSYVVGRGSAGVEVFGDARHEVRLRTTTSDQFAVDFVEFSARAAGSGSGIVEAIADALSSASVASEATASAPIHGDAQTSVSGGAMGDDSTRGVIADVEQGGAGDASGSGSVQVGADAQHFASVVTDASGHISVIADMETLLRLVSSPNGIAGWLFQGGHTESSYRWLGVSSSYRWLTVSSSYTRIGSSSLEILSGAR